MIVFEDVTKIYDPDVVGLQNFTCHIGKGEFVFLVGASGSGKSTLIKLVLKELVPDSGRILVAGRNLGTLRHSKVPLLRRNIGCVFQDFKLLPNKTVYDNVAYALEVVGEPRRSIRRKVPEILSLVGLNDKTNSYPHEISGGEQQRVSVARAFVNHPPLLLADEPTGNIDPETAVGIMQLLVRINRTGTSRSSWPPTTATWSTACAGACCSSTRGAGTRAARARRAARRLRPGGRRGGAGGAHVRLGFFLKEAFGSMRRNWVMAMAAVITVFISTAILGAVLVTRDNLNQGATSLKNRVLIEVFIKDDAPDEQKAALEQKIQQLQEQGVVKSYTYISKDEALKRFEDRFGPRIVQNLPINPLPASYEIQVKDANQVDAVAQKFFDEAGGGQRPRHAQRGQVRGRDGAQDARHHQPHRHRHVDRHRRLRARRRAAHQHDGAPQHLRPAP